MTCHSNLPLQDVGDTLAESIASQANGISWACPRTPTPVEPMTKRLLFPKSTLA